MFEQLTNTVRTLNIKISEMEDHHEEDVRRFHTQSKEMEEKFQAKLLESSGQQAIIDCLQSKVDAKA